MMADELARPMTLFKKKRLESGFSVAEVAQRARVDRGTVWRIEEAMIANPKAESLMAIGQVLEISQADILATVGWLPSDELPTLGPYLQAKYRQLPAEGVDEMESHFDLVCIKYGLDTTQIHPRLARPKES